MIIINNSTIQQFTLPGLTHQTLASQNDGLRGTEVWMQTIEPYGETPVHYHKCEKVMGIEGVEGKVGRQLR